MYPIKWTGLEPTEAAGGTIHLRIVIANLSLVPASVPRPSARQSARRGHKDLAAAEICRDVAHSLYRLPLERSLYLGRTILRTRNPGPGRVRFPWQMSCRMCELSYFLSKIVRMIPRNRVSILIAVKPGGEAEPDQ